MTTSPCARHLERATSGPIEVPARRRRGVRLPGDGMRSVHDPRAFGTGRTAGASTRRVQPPRMLVTSLNPHPGDDKTAFIATKAHHEGTSLRETAIASGHVTAKRFDRRVAPGQRVGR